MKIDTDLYADVAAELKDDPSIDSSRIAIGVRDGIVTLNGTVPTYWQKVEAEKAVKRLSGVRAVANELTVELPEEHRRDDVDIARAASEALAWHSDLPDTLKVSVSNRRLTLDGTVDWQFQKQEAERAVKYVTGLKGVTNDIRIRETPKVSDVRERIRKELERTVDMEANRIAIDTSDGRVVLSGTVHSWYEDDAARRAAWSVPGVRAVDDRLVVA